MSSTFVYWKVSWRPVNTASIDCGWVSISQIPVAAQTAWHLCSWLRRKGRVNDKGQNLENMHTRKDVFPMDPSREGGRGLRKVVYRVGRCRDMSFAFHRCVDHEIHPY